MSLDGDKDVFAAPRAAQSGACPGRHPRSAVLAGAVVAGALLELALGWPLAAPAFVSGQHVVAGLWLICGVAAALLGFALFRHQRGDARQVAQAGFASSGRDHAELRVQRLSAFCNLLAGLNEAVIRASQRDELFHDVCRILVEHGRMSMAWVGQYEKDAGHVRLLASHGPAELYRDGYNVSYDPTHADGAGPAGRALRSRQVQVANDVLNDPGMARWRARTERSGLRAKAVVPVVLHNDETFVVQIYSTQVDFFDAEVVQLLARMGNDLAHALENLERAQASRAAAAALAESEERFQLVVRGTNDGIFDWDMTCGYTYFSPRFKEILGYTEDEFDPRRSSFEERLHPDDRAPMQEAMRRHLEQRIPHQAEYRLRNKNGEWRWVQSRGQATWDADGKPVRFTGSIRDITSRKAAERASVRMTDLYSALIATNKAIMHVRDPQELFDAICRIVVEHGRFDAAWIGLRDGASSRLDVAAVGGAALTEIEEIAASIDLSQASGTSYVAQVLHDGHHAVVNDYLAEERLRNWWDVARARGMFSFGAFPLRRGGEVVGVLVLFGSEVGFFTEQLVDLLVEMTQDISFALDNFQREEERRATEMALRDSEENFRQLAANIPEVFWINQPRFSRVTYVSPAYERVWGRSAQHLLEEPRDWIDAIHPDDRERVELTLQTAYQHTVDHEYRIVRPDETVRWIHDRSFPIFDREGNLYRVVGIAEDITLRKEADARLLNQAHYDNLTHLPNRVLFYDRLLQALARARRERRVAAVMFVDLDRFKLVNDTLGHAGGDQLLRQVAVRLSETLRASDTAGRLGGDEFAIILSDLNGAEDAANVAQKLMGALERPFDVDGHEIFVTASAGITLHPSDGDDADTLIKNADVAMFKAKEFGRSNYQFYKAEMNERSFERLTMETHLRRALERNEFFLCYQPKVDLASGEITGMEALLRWQHPEFGVVSPVRFIPILEENGLIVPVGEWVLAEAARQLNAWSVEGLAHVPIAVNLSGRQLQQKGLEQRIRSILADANVEPRLIELEITESVLMRNAEHATGILRQLKAMGIRLSVDDFGTGYSSLSYLKSFPLDTLKIDRSFVRDITASPDDALITRAVISMSHSLRLKVVAEGVETKAQLSYLAANGCDEMQGFYFSPPVSAEEGTRLLRERHHLQLPSRGARDERTVLLVDDEPNIVSALNRLLRRDGYRILTATSAARGFELLAGNDVSVVISDQRMPDMTGVEFLRRVKDVYPETVRIVLSGFTDLQTVTDAINQGAVYKFFTKPWDDELLRSNVKEAFAHKALLDENRALTDRLKVLQAGIPNEQRAPLVAAGS